MEFDTEATLAGLSRRLGVEKKSSEKTSGEATPWPRPSKRFTAGHIGLLGRISTRGTVARSTARGIDAG